MFECLQNIITTFAGTGTAGSSGGGGPASSAQLNGPSAVVTDVSGNVYIADTSNNKIRKVSNTGTITTFAGTGKAGSSGDGGLATSAQLYLPSGVAVKIYYYDTGIVYIFDAGNGKIRSVSSTGIITTLAGTGTSGSSDGAAGLAQLGITYSIARGIAGQGSFGYVYFADPSYNKIRRMNSDGSISNKIRPLGERRQSRTRQGAG